MEIRNNIIKKFELIIKDKAEQIENDIMNYSITYCKNNDILPDLKNIIFKKIYIGKSRQIYYNLKENSYIKNKQIHNLIKKDKINLEKICKYSYKNLYPSKWKKYNKDLELLNKDVYDFDKEVQTTDAFTCPRCKKKKCVYTEFQTRSADEPSTLFITCVACGYFFRQ